VRENDIKSELGPNAPQSTLTLKAKKYDFVVWIYLTEAQIQLYRSFLSSDEVKSVLNKKLSPLAAITVMKKVKKDLIFLFLVMWI